MSRLSNHVPGLAGLVLAVVVAAVAYSVYDEGESARPESASGARGAGLTALDLKKPVASKPQSSVDSSRGRDRADGGILAPTSGGGTEAAPAVLTSGGAPGVGAPVLQPVATQPPASPPRSRPKPDGGTGLDRELQRLIDGPVAPRPKPSPPKGRGPVAPAPTPKPPNVAPPGGDASSGPPPAPTTGGPGATPTDPEAGLDDTAVGGLDQTDLGEPVDETDTGATPVDPGATPTDPGATPTDPEASLDDTAGGGLDQTDLGQPVDDTGTGTGADTGAGPVSPAA